MADAKSKIKKNVFDVNTAVRLDYQKMHAGGKMNIQLKYQKPHSPFLTLNASEEQFTPPRKEKLLDVESKTLIGTDA